MDTEYSAYRDGELIQVPTMEKLCQALTVKFQNEEKRIAILEEENKKLKEGVWAKEEFIKLKKYYEIKEKDWARGFDISEAEADLIRSWKERHIKMDHNGHYVKSAMGGQFSYIFTPTSIGVIGEITCTCGASCEFRSLN